MCCFGAVPRSFDSALRAPLRMTEGGRFAPLRMTKREERQIVMYFVYILTNHSHHSLYIGVTNNLERRLYEHKSELLDGYTKQYHLHKLVYYEAAEDVNAAIAREKQLKGWTRKKKDALIASVNPLWEDLSEDWD